MSEHQQPKSLEPLDTTAEIETPEHVRFRYHLAGPARRFFAYVIDVLVMGLIVVAFAVVFLIAGFGLGDELGAASIGVLAIIVFLISWFYFLGFEVLWSGRSPGKRALHLRVISQEGHPMRFWQSFLRNLLRAADFLPSFYALGVLVMGNDRRFRRLGDLAAGTMVVVDKRHLVDGPVRLDPPPTPQELASLPQRLPLDGDDLEAIELLLRREYRVAPARAYELASMVAPIYAARLSLRVNDPLRFLKILYARARGIVGVEAQPTGQWQPQQQGAWRQPGGQWPGPRPGYGPAYPPPGMGSPGPAPPGYGPPGYGPIGHGPGGYGPAPYGQSPAPPGYGPPGYGPLPQGYGPPQGYGGAPAGYGPTGYAPTEFGPGPSPNQGYGRPNRRRQA